MSDSTDTQDTDDGEDVGSAVWGSNGPKREEMVNSYLPEQDDWEAKTILDVNDPAAVAALSNLEKMYPEVDDLQPLVDDFMEEFMKTRTSVGGESRDDFRKMFVSMFGGNPDGDGESSAVKLVAADDD